MWAYLFLCALPACKKVKDIISAKIPTTAFSIPELSQLFFFLYLTAYKIPLPMERNNVKTKKKLNQKE